MIEIDAKRLLCPMPVIRIGEAIQQANIGDEVKIVASDIGVLHDIPAWCKVHSQEVVSVEEGDFITIVVKKINE